MNTNEKQPKQIESLYIRKPRLLRVAQELSKFEEPYKAMDALLLLLKGCTENPANSN